MDAERFIITVRAEPGFAGTLQQRLRTFLKIALRACGIRCVKIVAVKPEVDESADVKTLVEELGI